MMDVLSSGEIPCVMSKFLNGMKIINLAPTIMQCKLSGMANTRGPIISLVQQFLNLGIQFILEGRHGNQFIKWADNKLQGCIYS